MGKKQRRVAERIRKILSSLLQSEVRDPRLSDVTVMEVRIDRELMYATVYVNALRGEEARDEVMAGLESASGFLRRELAQRIRLQHAPELRFNWDETLAHGERIDRLLASLNISPDSSGQTEASDEGDA